MLVRFWANHHLLDLFQRPVWRVVKDRSRTYVQKILAGALLTDMLSLFWRNLSMGPLVKDRVVLTSSFKGSSDTMHQPCCHPAVAQAEGAVPACRAPGCAAGLPCHQRRSCSGWAARQGLLGSRPEPRVRRRHLCDAQRHHSVCAGPRCPSGASLLAFTAPLLAPVQCESHAKPSASPAATVAHISRVHVCEGVCCAGGEAAAGGHSLWRERGLPPHR